MKKEISMEKKYRQRNGREAKVLSTTMRDSLYPVVAILDYTPDEQRVHNMTEFGNILTDGDDNRDLVEIKEKKTAWVNIYSGTSSSAHLNKELADFNPKEERIACIKVEYEEGEGL